MTTETQYTHSSNAFRNFRLDVNSQQEKNVTRETDALFFFFFIRERGVGISDALFCRAASIARLALTNLRLILDQ